MAPVESILLFTDYRVVLFHPRLPTLLTPSDLGNEQRLNRIRVPNRSRVTPFLVEALQARWGVSAFVVDYLSTLDGLSPCAVLELLSRNVPSTLRTLDLDQVRTDDLSDHERALLRELQTGENTASVSRLGWIDDAVRWLETTTGEQLRSKCDIEQHNAGRGFALLRFKMGTGRRYWLKATGEPNRHEQAISASLSKLCGMYVPEVLEVRLDWNAWLMRELESATTTPLRFESQQTDLLESATIALAEIQRRTIDRETDLFQVGAFDHRISALYAHSELLFERIEEAMSRQISTKAPRIVGRALRELREAFEAICEVVDRLSIPATVLHGDLNAGNVLYGAGHCQFIDWCETYVGCPVVTLQHLLLLNQVAAPGSRPVPNQRLVDRYRFAMRRACDDDALDKAIICMPVIAAASTLYGRGARPGSAFKLQHQDVYVRTLARHMQQALNSASLQEIVSKGQVACNV